jgi:pyridine nucleotide-disulfide oxidoreductase
LLRGRDRAAGVVAVVGAGPHGLATAAHLRRAGVETIVFGRVLDFWRRNMPGGMMLRSRERSSSISDPDRRFGIAAWAAAAGRRLDNPIPIEDFVEYGDWFQERAVAGVDSRLVRSIDLGGRSFHLTLEDGSALDAGRVVVAAGLSPFPRRPALFDDLSRELASHSSEHTGFSRFAGRRVAVIGGGQSALESAALLREAGAAVEILVRAVEIRWLLDVSVPRAPTLAERLLPPTDVGGRVTGWIAATPDAYRSLPAKLQKAVEAHCIAPAGAGWLERRLAGVSVGMAATVVAADSVDGHVRLTLDDGGERLVDHVLLGTGFEIDVTRYPFLGDEVLRRLETRGGYPVLGRGLESSIPGLHFVGAPAARSFGPIMRFVVGSWYAAPAVCRRILARPQPPLRFSF